MSNIKIENLTVVYEVGKKDYYVALDDLNLDIKDNSFNVIIGYSGCGKTTLLRCIAGLIDYEGSIYIDGLDSSKMSFKDRNIAMVTQNYSLYPRMTVFDNIAFPISLTDASKEEVVKRVNEVAKELKIEHCLTRKPKHLSGGQQQRVALARALIKKPSIYLFDEPLSNFDYPTRVESKVLIKNMIKNNHATAIYVTHDISEAMSLADNLIVINDKKIEISGDPLTVYNSGNEIVESLKGATMDEQLVLK